MSPLRFVAAFAAALAVVAAAGTASAQATRTWVSGVGDDANPCSRTAPCQTFAGAYSKTAVGGEIDALDPGSFGTVTITHAITLDGRGAVPNGGAAVSGVTVNAGATDAVHLRSLSLNGSGTGSGIFVMSAGLVDVENVAIGRFADGIVFTPAAGGQLVARDVVLDGNATSGVTVGSSGGTSRATLIDVRAAGNGVGVLANGGARVSLYGGDASHNVGAGISADVGASGGTAEINLEDVAVTGNGVGVSAAGTSGAAIVRLSQVLATGNVTSPIAASGVGQLQSFGNNRLDVVPALALSSTAPSQTVTAGQTATYAVDVAVTGLTPQPITFACSGLPAGATCQVTPATLPAGTSTGAVSVAITTTAPPAGGFVLPSTPWGPLSGAALLALALLLALAALTGRRRFAMRRVLGGAAAVVLVAALGAVSACRSSAASASADMATAGGQPDMTGSGDQPDMAGTGMTGTGDDMAGSPDMATPPAASTPSGTYQLTLTATSGTLTGTLPLTLVVN